MLQPAPRVRPPPRCRSLRRAASIVLLSARRPQSRAVETSLISGSPERAASGTRGAAHCSNHPRQEELSRRRNREDLVVTGQANTPVWVSVEGRDLRSAKLLRSSGATAEFDYTVSSGDQPGFFVSAQFLRGGQIYQGEKRVKVPPEDHQLNLKLTTDKAQYLPGQTAAYTVDATTADGKTRGRCRFESRCSR